jgi:hypothetical protein
MRSLADFKHLRRKDGALPRLLIIPARLAISASAESAELKAETGK